MNKLWAYLKTKDFLRNFLGAIGTVLAVVLIAYFSLGFYTHHGSGIPVPQLIGQPIERAIPTLESQGFEYKIDSVYVLDKPPGTVIQQDPDAGTNVKEGRFIYLTIVTRLAPNVKLPDLKDKTYREAVAILANYGLKVRDTTYKPDIARDVVLSVSFSNQELQAGASVPKGSQLDLVLGDGQGGDQVNIPDLVNLDLDAAKFAIKGAGLNIGTVIYQGAITDSSNVTVISQVPAKTDSVTQANRGTPVNLTVIQGKKTDDPH